MRLSFFSRRQPLQLFFPSDGCANVLVAFKVEQAVAAIGCSEAFQRALLMLHDAQIQVAGDANVKRACMAAENVDVAAGHNKDASKFWFSAPAEDMAEPPLPASVVEKLRAAWVR